MLVVDLAVGPWVFNQLGFPPPVCGYTSFGIVDNTGELQAGVVFTNYTEHNITVNLVIKHPRYALKLGTAICHYVYGQLGLERLTIHADADNLRAIKQYKRLGAELEGTMKRAGRNGNDILIFALWDDNPIWRELNGRFAKPTTISRLRETDSAADREQRLAIQ